MPAHGAIAAVAPFQTPEASLLDAIRTQLISGEQLRIWDAGKQQYTTVGTNDESAVAELSAGEGFWIENPLYADQAIWLVGLVPLDDSLPVAFQPGMNLFGVPYSAPLRLAKTVWASDGAISGTVLTADRVTDPVTSQYWWLTSLGLWQAEQVLSDADLLIMGQGYWYQHHGKAGLTTRIERPYALPVKTDLIQAALPTIKIDSGKAVITIPAAEGSVWDLYYKDISITGQPDLVRGWQPVAQDIKPVGSVVPWIDPAPSSARLYLPARADIDSDGDGVPDSRELFRYHTDPAKTDSDQDGVPDGWEINHNLNPLLDDASADADQDGIGNRAEYERGTDPLDAHSTSAIFYVDAAVGDDAWPGTKAGRDGFAGPFKTINKALRSVIRGDTVYVRPGRYMEPVDECGLGINLVITGDVFVNVPEEQQ